MMHGHLSNKDNYKFFLALQINVYTTSKSGYPFSKILFICNCKFSQDSLLNGLESEDDRNEVVSWSFILWQVLPTLLQSADKFGLILHMADSTNGK